MIATRLRVSSPPSIRPRAGRSRRRHDRDGVDAADRAEPAAPVRAAHDGDHPAHRLLVLACRQILPSFGRQVAGQDGEVTAVLATGPAGPVLELIQGQPAGRRVITSVCSVTSRSRPRHAGIRPVRSPHAPCRVSCRAVRVRRGRESREGRSHRPTLSVSQDVRAGPFGKKKSTGPSRPRFQPGFDRPLLPRRQALVPEQVDAGMVDR